MDKSIATKQRMCWARRSDSLPEVALVLLAWFACNQIGVLDAVMLNQDPQSQEFLQLIRWLKVQRHNLQSLIVIFSVQGFKEGRLVMAIGAATEMLTSTSFPAKVRIVVGDDPPT